MDHSKQTRLSRQTRMDARKNSHPYGIMKGVHMGLSKPDGVPEQRGKVDTSPEPKSEEVSI